MPGTFPLAEIKLDSPTAPDVLVASTWKLLEPVNGRSQVEMVNDGYREYQAGGGMHVTLSPTDLHNTAVAAGPDFRRGLKSSLSSSNIDVVPTLLWLMDIKPLAPLDGRVLSEALNIDAATSHKIVPGQLTARKEFKQGTWEQELKFTEVDGVRYLEEGNGRWTPRSTSMESAASSTSAVRESGPAQAN